MLWTGQEHTASLRTSGIHLKMPAIEDGVRSKRKFIQSKSKIIHTISWAPQPKVTVLQQEYKRSSQMNGWSRVRCLSAGYSQCQQLVSRWWSADGGLLGNASILYLPSILVWRSKVWYCAMCPPVHWTCIRFDGYNLPREPCIPAIYMRAEQAGYAFASGAGAVLPMYWNGRTLVRMQWGWRHFSQPTFWWANNKNVSTLCARPRPDQAKALHSI